MTTLKKKSILWFSVIAFFGFNGCVVTYIVTTDKPERKQRGITPQELIQKVRGDVVDMKLKGKADMHGTIISAGSDSVSFVSRADTSTVAFSELESVTETRYLVGALVYFPTWTIAGAFAGLLIGPAVWSGGWGGLTGFVLGAGIGSVTGFTFGIIIPPKAVYKIQSGEK